MRTKRGLAAVVVAVLVALVACEGVPVDPHQVDYYTDDAGYHGSGPRVAILGDSITNAAHDRLHNEIGYRSTRITSMAGEGLAGGPWTWFLGTPGPIMVERAQELAATQPRVAIVALGTNDAWYPPLTATDPIPPMDAIYGALDGACTVGVLVAEDTTAVHYDEAKAATINARTRQLADVVVDWRLTVDPAHLQADGIHLGPAAEDSFVLAVRAGVQACLSPPA